MDVFLTILAYGLPILLLFVGLIVGGAVERRHFRSLEEREAAVADMLISQLKTFPLAGGSVQPPKLLVTEVVISSDYLKSFLATIRNIFGGEVRSFQTLLTRSRREALLRLAEQARAEGYNALCNVRFDTADIGGSSQKKIHMSSVLASATAYLADV